MLNSQGVYVCMHSHVPAFMGSAGRLGGCRWGGVTTPSNILPQATSNSRISDSARSPFTRVPSLTLSVALLSTCKWCLTGPGVRRTAREGLA